MSEEIKDNTTWDADVAANFDYGNETEYFQEWLAIEALCDGKNTSPGFYEWHGFATLPGITPGAEEGRSYPIRWTTYRAEDGTLLVVHCCFVDPQGVQKPVTLFTHPEHQRQGHGKVMLEYLKERYVRETGKLNPNESWKEARITTPGAGFLNWAGENITEFNKTIPD